MAKKNQKRKSSNNNPKIIFLVILVLLGTLIGYLYVAGKANKYSSNPNQDQKNYAYEESGVTTENGISTYSFEEFGHGYSFKYPSEWILKNEGNYGYNANSLKVRSLIINDHSKIIFGIFEPTYYPEPVDVNNAKKLSVDGYAAYLAEFGGIVDAITNTYKYDNAIVVPDVIYAKRVTSKDIKDYKGIFMMNATTSKDDQEGIDELNMEFRKVYETLKFH